MLQILCRRDWCTYIAMHWKKIRDGEEAFAPQAHIVLRINCIINTNSAIPGIAPAHATQWSPSRHRSEVVLPPIRSLQLPACIRLTTLRRSLVQMYRGCHPPSPVVIVDQQSSQTTQVRKTALHYPTLASNVPYI
jgi:hypothetical protein